MKKRTRVKKNRNVKSGLSQFLEHPVIQTIAGVTMIVFGMVCLLSFLSFDPGDQSYNTYSGGGAVKNLCGKPGAFLSDQLLQAFGYPAYLIVFYLAGYGYTKLRRRQISLKVLRGLGAFITLMSISALISLPETGKNLLGQSFMSGGWVGEFLSMSLLKHFTGTTSILIGILFTFLSSLMWLGSLAVRIPRAFLLKAIAICREILKFSVRIAGYVIGIVGSLGQLRRKETRIPIREQTDRELEIENKPRKEKKTEPAKQTLPVQEKMEFDENGYSYQVPSISFLKEPKHLDRTDLEKDLERNAVILEEKLRDFGVDGNVTQVIPGPVITQYEFEPAPGIKINKIINLSEDLALALKAKFAPRVAHIPGKSVVGVEIPNVKREVVFIKDLIGSEIFQQYEGKLKIALGKDIRGKPYITNLESMPHLLVAGATGSGKSVCINSILISFLYALSPKELQLLLIDPKMLELSVYNGIPHLREAVITDSKKAATALEWAVQEMEDRYNLLALKGVRNIEQYNAEIAQESSAKSAADADAPVPLPYLVVIIDELADLMMVASAAVENSIARLAQMARAAGIHLILATQRPSVDVLTGFIKANLPCRIAFQVASKVDSRTILDMNGAEKLLGNGDMLMIPPGTSREKRLHGAYVSESEIKLVVEFLKKTSSVQQQESIFKTFQSKPAQQIESDPLFNEAIEIVVTSGQASISMLQRRLRVGHSRAARLIDMMEQEGYVGPFEGSKPREILIQKEELESILNGVNI